jgi:hypothetical protein
MVPCIVSIFQYISNKMQRYTVYLYQETARHVSGRYFHPSSGAHTTVSTSSGTCHTVTAICRYRGRVGTGLSVLWVAYATHGAPDDGWKCHPKHVEKFQDINKLCNVASFWIYIAILLWAHPILRITRIRVNPICHLLALLGAHPILHISRMRLNWEFKIDSQNAASICCSYLFVRVTTCFGPN